MIIYCGSIADISVRQLKGFFVGWKNPLTPEQHYELLCSSDHFVVAVDENSNQIVGFITALSDGVCTSFIPLLEVLPEYKNMGIGTRLVELILSKLQDIPNVDLMCDPELQPFYKRFNMHKSTGMILRKKMNKNMK